LIAPGAGGPARDRCHWAQIGCKWDRNHRHRAHADCTRPVAGAGRESARFRPADHTGSPAASICSFSSRERSAPRVCLNRAFISPGFVPSISVSTLAV
jgi:hypothetical protein